MVSLNAKKWYTILFTVAGTLVGIYLLVDLFQNLDDFIPNMWKLIVGFVLVTIFPFLPVFIFQKEIRAWGLRKSMDKWSELGVLPGLNKMQEKSMDRLQGMLQGLDKGDLQAEMDPIKVLKLRLAAGEISEEEYHRLRYVLEEEEG